MSITNCNSIWILKRIIFFVAVLHFIFFISFAFHKQDEDLFSCAVSFLSFRLQIHFLALYLSNCGFQLVSAPDFVFCSAHNGFSIVFFSVVVVVTACCIQLFVFLYVCRTWRIQNRFTFSIRCAYSWWSEVCFSFLSHSAVFFSWNF